MQEKIEQSIKAYQASWEQLVQARTNSAFFRQLKPVAAGWKVVDRAEYDALYAELHDRCDRIVETWMNGRWVAKMHLRDQALPGGITIIKVMERRPNSSDAVGLDHVDFYSPDAAIQEALTLEADLKWSIESNDVIEDYKWVSVWFDNTEAKLKAGTVLDIIIKELGQISDNIKS
jgi:hypothetical protein